MEISELFIFASFGIVGFSKFGNFLEISRFFKLAKILRRHFGNNFGNNFLFRGKKPCYWVKKTCCWGFWDQKHGFPNIPNLQIIWNLFYSELSENYEKMTLKSNFGNCKKLVPTQKPTRMFGLKFGMQGLNINTKY